MHSFLYALISIVTHYTGRLTTESEKFCFITPFHHKNIFSWCFSFLFFFLFSLEWLFIAALKWVIKGANQWIVGNCCVGRRVNYSRMCCCYKTVTLRAIPLSPLHLTTLLLFSFLLQHTPKCLNPKNQHWLNFLIVVCAVCSSVKDADVDSVL